MSPAVRRSRPGAAAADGGVGAHGLRRQREEVGSQGRPGWFVVSPAILVGLVELCDDLGSDELLGRDVEPVGVALDGLEEPGRWVVELAQQGAG